MSPTARESLFPRLDKEGETTHLGSVPNPSLITSYLDGHGAASGMAYSNEVCSPYGDGNGASGLRNGSVKLRVPTGRRLVCVPPIPLLLIVSIASAVTTHKLPLMFIRLKSTIIMPDSPRPWKPSNADTIQRSLLSRKESWNGRGQKELNPVWDSGCPGMGTAEMMYRHGWIGSTCHESGYDS